jgi:hypothetical protein
MKQALGFISTRLARDIVVGALNTKSAASNFKSYFSSIDRTRKQ